MSTTSPRSLQYLFASTYRSALTEVPLTNTPPALVFEIMYVSGPVGMTPLEAHAASNRQAETGKIFMVPPELRRPILWTLPSYRTGKRSSATCSFWPTTVIDRGPEPEMDANGEFQALGD